MVPQVWGMLASDASMLTHLLRAIGMGEIASQLAKWFDQTLDTVTEISERMEDWTSLAFCALQQVVLADIASVNEIDDRVVRAREIMGRIPESERTRHLEECCDTTIDRRPEEAEAVIDCSSLRESFSVLSSAEDRDTDVG